MPRSPDVACSVCGVLMWRGGGSLPEGERTCQPCRARRREEAETSRLNTVQTGRTLVCPHCHQTFTTTVASKVYCSKQHKQAAKVARRPKPPRKLRAPMLSCTDCSARIPRHVVTSEPALCTPCQTLRRAQLRQRHRQDKSGALALTVEPPSWLARLFNRRRSA